MPRAAADGLDRADGSSGARARLAPVSCPCGGEHGGLQRQPGVHVLRILLVERLLPRCEGLHRRQRDPLGRGDRPAAHRVGRARDPHRGRRSRPRSGRHVRPGWARALPSGTRRPARCVHYENTRLLLLSASPAFPRGLSNNHGQVGKHFTAHATPFVYGLFPGRRLNLFNGLWAQATCLDDWNADNFDHAGLGFRRRRDARGAAGSQADRDRERAAAAGECLAGGRAGSPGSPSTHSRSATPRRNSTASRTRRNGLDLDPAVVDPTRRAGRSRHTWRCRRTSTEATTSCSTGSAAGSRRPARQRPGTAERRIVEGRHCYGGTRMGDDPRDVRRRSLRLLPRGSEPRGHRRIDVPDGGRLEPDADRPGARLANGATTGGQLERDRGCSVITEARIRPRIE